MENGRETWRIEIRSKEFMMNERHEYYVFAKSAGMAEKRSLALAKKDGVAKPYCRSAEFHCYVH